MRRNSKYPVRSGKLTAVETKSGQRPSAGGEQLVDLRWHPAEAIKGDGMESGR